MSYCEYCGQELASETKICPSCGCPTKKRKSENQSKKPAMPTADDKLYLAAKYFYILNIIFIAVYFCITFFIYCGENWGDINRFLSVCSILLVYAWLIPMFVHFEKRRKKNLPVSLAFKISTLILCNVISGILLLCSLDMLGTDEKTVVKQKQEEQEITPKQAKKLRARNTAITIIAGFILAVGCISRILAFVYAKFTAMIGILLISSVLFWAFYPVSVFVAAAVVIISSIAGECYIFITLFSRKPQKIYIKLLILCFASIPAGLLLLLRKEEVYKERIEKQ